MELCEVPHSCSMVEMMKLLGVFLLTMTGCLAQPNSRCLVDMCVVVDESDNIEATEWQNIKDFLTNVFGSARLGPDLNQIGLVQFNRDGRVVFGLNDHSDTSKSLLGTISAMSAAGGAFDMGSGIRTAMDDCLGPAEVRGTVPLKMLVIGDGEATDGASAIAAAEEARNAGITIITIDTSAMENNVMANVAGNIEDNILHIDESSGYTWSRARHDFIDLRSRSWCNNVLCRLFLQDGILNNFDQEVKNVPGDKMTLFEYNPPSSPCKMMATFKKNRLITSFGVNPDNPNKYYRVIDFSDATTQHGWMCDEENQTACPSAWPNFTYPYQVMSPQGLQYASFRDKVEYSMYIQQMGQGKGLEAHCPGHDWPKYKMYYVSNPEPGVPNAVIAISKAFYEEHMDELIGECI